MTTKNKKIVLEETSKVKKAYIRFMAPVDPRTTDQLLKITDGLIRDGYERIHLLISSPGGSVFHGLSTYNFLKGSPLEVYTYNFGSVDSISSVIFAAGSRRFSVPHARFLIHGVKMNLVGNFSFDEKSLEESLKSLQIDQQNIAKVIADTCGKPTNEVEGMMNDRTTFNPTEAKSFGLVTEIKSDLVPKSAQVFNIYEPQQNVPTGQPFPMVQPVASIPGVLPAN